MGSYLDQLAGSDDYDVNVVRPTTATQTQLDTTYNNAIGAKDQTTAALNNAVNSSRNTFAPDMNMNAALSNKYRQSLAQGLQGVEAKNVLTPYASGAQALGNSRKLASQQLQIANQNLARLRNAEAQHEQARSQILGSIMGLVFPMYKAASAPKSNDSKVDDNSSQFTDEDFQNGASQADATNNNYDTTA